MGSRIALTLALAALAAWPVSAVNIPPGATVDHASVVGSSPPFLCPPALRDCVFLVQEIPGTSTHGAILGNDVDLSYIQFSFPDAVSTTGAQEFVIHISATVPGGAGFAAQLWEDGNFVRSLLFDGIPGMTIIHIPPGEDELFFLPWELSELSNTSGDDVELRVHLWGDLSPPCPDSPCPRARLEAVGWDN